MIMETLFWVCVTGIVYHHAIYPKLLTLFARRAKRLPPLCRRKDGKLPSVTIIVPAYNEARFIAAKIANTVRLNYPPEHLRLIIGCDGCSDQTAGIAKSAATSAISKGFKVEIIEFAENRGKVALLNDLIAHTHDEIVVLTDASASLREDALMHLTQWFENPAIGVVSSCYQPADGTNAGEQAYWRYQNQIKAMEGALGAPMGTHGACYAIRRSDWTPLAPDTINDDFILPMKIISKGRTGIYDEEIPVLELEASGIGQDYRRRIRISAGNMQQSIRMWRLAKLHRPGLAFAFISGKGLRPLIPFMIVIAFVLSGALALNETTLYRGIFGSQSLLYSAALIGTVWPKGKAPAALATLSYLVVGHWAGLIGGSRFLLGLDRGQWKKVSDRTVRSPDFMDPLARFGKRAFDIVGALIGVAVLTVVFVPIAFAIKRDSPGPVLYRQLRVGRQTRNATHLFYLTKFRSMRSDAESKSDPVWASESDPRITRIGRFLRKTRLDELPQCFAVLRGEMSLVGPRPERPSFFPKLEQEIPFYAERIFDLKPGITGLAQVNQGYDTSIEDVRSKVLFDHAYAVKIARPLDWLKTDFDILWRTIGVVFGRRGR